MLKIQVSQTGRHKGMLMNHREEIRMFQRKYTSLLLTSPSACDWLTYWLIFVFLDYLSCMQKSTPLLNIPTPQLFAYYESWNILAGNSERPKVHTFFIWLIFPAAAWCLNKTNYSASKRFFFHVPQFVKSKQVPVCFFCFHRIKCENNKHR